MKSYLCVKDYCPIIHKTNGLVEPTDEPVIRVGDILNQQEPNSNVYSSTLQKDMALYEFTILEYNNNFVIIINL